MIIIFIQDIKDEINYNLVLIKYNICTFEFILVHEKLELHNNVLGSN